MDRIFITEEEVQVWVDGQDRVRRNGGRLGLVRMVDRGGLSFQSDALARQWLGDHPPREDRRSKGPAAPAALVRAEPRRRAGDACTGAPFTAPLAWVAVLVVLAVTTTPFWHRQTVFSYVDGGFNTVPAEMARARHYALVDSSGRRFGR